MWACQTACYHDSDHCQQSSRSAALNQTTSAAAAAPRATGHMIGALHRQTQENNQVLSTLRYHISANLTVLSDLNHNSLIARLRMRALPGCSSSFSIIICADVTKHIRTSLHNVTKKTKAAMQRQANEHWKQLQAASTSLIAKHNKAMQAAAVVNNPTNHQASCEF